MASSVGDTSAGDNTPATFQEAEKQAKWRDSIMDEWKSLAKQNTFEFTDNLPSEKEAIPCKWVFKTKDEVANKRYKSRLVIKGFKQCYGVITLKHLRL